MMKPNALFAVLFSFLVLGAAAQPDALREVQDSIWRWRTAHATDPLAQNITGSGQLRNAVEVRLLRADSAARSDFRLRVHDSPLIRLCGFDPDTTPYPQAPEGNRPPEGVELRAEYATYAPGTEHVRLTIRSRLREMLYFGTDYTVCRFQHGRWETLPVCQAWNALLIGLGPDPFRPSDATRCAVPAAGYAYTFTAWLAPAVFPAPYGRYRVCKNVYAENPRREYLLTTEFAVMPFVPFTRFSR